MALCPIAIVIFLGDCFTAGTKDAGILGDISFANMAFWNTVVRE
jgi:hypothetical protein